MGYVRLDKVRESEIGLSYQITRTSVWLECVSEGWVNFRLAR